MGKAHVHETWVGSAREREDEPPLALLVVSGGAWKGIWDRPKALALEFANLGVRTAFLAIGPSASQWLHKQVHPFEAPPGLSVLPTVPMPPGWSRVGGCGLGLYKAIGKFTVYRALSRLGDYCNSSRLVTLVHHPLAWLATRALGEAGPVFYDVMDDWSGLIREPQLVGQVQALERDIISRSSAVFAVSSSLANKVREFGKTAQVIPNGVDVRLFQFADSRGASPPLVGFVGTLGNWVDYSWLTNLVEAVPDVRFEIIGPGAGSAGKKARLWHLPNVRVRGAIPYSLVPAEMGRFTVGLIPFRTEGAGLHADPIKLYEYLAAGCAVVSTPIPAATRLTTETDVFVAHSGREAADLVRRLISVDGSEQRRLRYSYVLRNHSWRARAQAMLKAIQSRTYPSD